MSKEFNAFLKNNPEINTSRKLNEQFGADIWSWGPRSPFFQGFDAIDYLNKGGLVEELPDYTNDGNFVIGAFQNVFQDLNTFLLSKPKNSLVLLGMSTAIDQIQALDGTMVSMSIGSNTDLPDGWYQKNTSLRIVKPNYDNNTLSRYTFVLKSATSSAIQNSKFPEIAAIGVALSEKFTQKIATVLETLTGGLVNIEVIDFSDFGVWVLQAVEQVPLKPLRDSGTAFTDTSKKGLDNSNFPLLPVALIGGGLLTGMIPLSILGGGLLLLKRGK